jgi:D-aspartate ligase
MRSIKASGGQRGKSVVPAVVVGADVNGLGVLRSLAAGGVTTHLLGLRDGIGMHSRHGHKHIVADTGGDALQAGLMSLSQNLGLAPGERPVLFLTEEKGVRTVSERRAEILPYFRILLPEANRLSSLMDKTSFQVLAQAAGGRIPSAVSISTEADGPCLEELRYPAVLKPAYKHYGYGARFQKAYVVASAAEALSLWRKIAPVMPDLIVQEWIAGSDSDIYFCLQYIAADGTTVASFVGRKLRSWPPRIGGTASCIAAPECEDELTATTRDFFRAVGFCGMGSMEFKRHADDGAFYMVEPTVARTDVQEEVATLNGVNIPLAAYLHEVDAAAPAFRRTDPLALWRDSVTDRWALELCPGQRPESAIRHTTFDACLRLADPVPGVVYVWKRIVARCRQIVGRVIQAKDAG